MKTNRSIRFWLFLLACAALTPAANAFYNPQPGRWLNRDPIGDTGGLNEFSFVINSPVNAFDLLGQAMRETTPGNTYSGCGSWGRTRALGDTTTFSTPVYIVQEITRSIQVRNCRNGVIYSSSHHYWEAFGPFPANQLIFTADNWSLEASGLPIFGNPDMSESKGSDSIIASASIFPVSTTGDLGSVGIPPAGTPPGASLWLPGMDPLAGDLPATTIQPTWWNAPPLSGPMNLSVNFSWDCCCPYRPPGFHSFN